MVNDSTTKRSVVAPVARTGRERGPPKWHVERVRSLCSNRMVYVAVSDDSSKRDVERMRWVCAHVCPSRVGCERDVEDELAAGRLVAGFRAGVSVRARARRLATYSDEKTPPAVQ